MKNPKYISKIQTYFHYDEVQFNGIVQPHYHNFTEVEFVVSGENKTVIENNEYALKRGSVCLISVPHIHSYPEETSGNFRILKVTFNESLIKNKLIEQFLLAQKSIVCRFSEEDAEWIESVYRAVKKNLDDKSYYSYHMAVNLVELLILSILNESGESSVSKLSPTVQTALKYINSHFSENIALADVANICYLSEDHFSRKFREYTGQSFVEYLRNVRLSHARRMLLNTDKSIEDIAEFSGFNDTSYFIRTFKKHFKEAPGKYRKKYDNF